MQDGLGFGGAFAGLVHSDEDLLLHLIGVDADQVAEVWAGHGVEHDRVVCQCWEHSVLQHGEVVDDHAAMVCACAFVLRRFEVVGVEGLDRQSGRVVLPAGDLVVDGVHLRVYGDFDLCQHAFELVLVARVGFSFRGLELVVLVEPLRSAL